MSLAASVHATFERRCRSPLPTFRTGEASPSVDEVRRKLTRFQYADTYGFHERRMLGELPARPSKPARRRAENADLESQFLRHDADGFSEIRVIADEGCHFKSTTEGVGHEVSRDVHVGSLLFTLQHLGKTGPIRQRKTNRIREEMAEDQLPGATSVAARRYISCLLGASGSPGRALMRAVKYLIRWI